MRRQGGGLHQRHPLDGCDGERGGKEGSEGLRSGSEKGNLLLVLVVVSESTAHFETFFLDVFVQPRRLLSPISQISGKWLLLDLCISQVYTLRQNSEAQAVPRQAHGEGRDAHSSDRPVRNKSLPALFCIYLLFHNKTNLTDESRGLLV